MQGPQSIIGIDKIEYVADVLCGKHILCRLICKCEAQRRLKEQGMSF